MKVTTIYLADLCHNQFGLARSSISLGVGTIGAYLIKKFEKKVNIKLFTVYEDLMEACKIKKPDIVGLANFGWNENLTVKTVSVLRRDFPNVLIITGGANISPFGGTDFSSRKKPPSMTEAFGKENDLQILTKMPEIDYFIHGYGEIPFVGLVDGFIKNNFSRNEMINNKVIVPGSSLVFNNQLIFGGTPPMLSNLDDFDSPYALGLYDDILKKYDLVPQIETDRGCPYECGFCTIGGWSNRVMKHSVDWIKKEVMDLNKRSRIKMLRIANSNFGLLKQDIEIAQFIKDLRAKTGYPNAIRVYSAARGANERVKNLMKNLGDMLPLNISFQTLTGDVLKNITRVNQSDEVIKEMSQFAVNNNLMLTTEIICGLPGETYKSYIDTYNQLFEYGFDSAVYGPLVLIRGSDFFTSEAREKYQFKTKYVFIEKSATEVEGKLYFEYDECPVQSISYNEKEYWDMHKVSAFVYMTSGGGYYKELFKHARNNGIQFKDIFNEIKDNPSKYPIFAKSLSGIVSHIQKFYFSDEESLRKKLEEEIKIHGSPKDIDIYNEQQIERGKLVSREHRKKFIDQFANAILNIYLSKAGIDGDEFCSILENLKKYTESIIICPQELPKEKLNYTFDYDLSEWTKGGCASPLTDYKLKFPKNFTLKVRNYSEHEMLDKVTKDWSPRRRTLFYYRQVVSSNHRRIIEGV